MEKLGVQLIPLVTQILNFMVLVFVLNKYLYKPILNMLSNRKNKIEEGLRFSEKAKEEVEKIEKQRIKILAEAKEEGKKITEEAKKIGKKVQADMLEKAQKEVAAMKEQAKKDIKEMEKEIEKRFESQTVQIAKAMVEKLLKDAISEKQQEVYFEKKIKELHTLRS